jgi:hypothetical protein
MSHIYNCKRCGKEFAVNINWQNPYLCKECFNDPNKIPLSQKPKAPSYKLPEESSAIGFLRVIAWCAFVIFIISIVLHAMLNNLELAFLAFILALVIPTFLLVISSIAKNLEAISFNTATIIEHGLKQVDIKCNKRQENEIESGFKM